MKYFVLAVFLAGCPKMPTPEGTCEACGGGPEPMGAGGGTTLLCLPPLAPGTPLRLLTRAEYNNTVRDLLGDTSLPAKDFPREPLAHGFDNNALLNQVSPDSVSRYLEASEALAADTLANRRSLVVPCSTDDAVCEKTFLETFGRRAYRRPLNADERQSLTSLFDAAKAPPEGSFNAAVAVSLETMLQAPQFLYRDESAVQPIPVPAVNLSGFELATRLSYFLWATTPDDALLDAAGAGTLDTEEGLRSEAARMLQSPKSIDGLMRFFSLWLDFEAVGQTEKDVTTYTSFTPALAGAWRESLNLFVRDVMNGQGTLPALLTSNVLFTNNVMPGYGPTAPTAAFVRTVMSNGQRIGLLSQPGFLGYRALPNGSSPIRRGVFVLDKLLCEPPPPPPAGVNITPPLPSVSNTTRERFSKHSKDSGCAGCHVFIDPPGWTMENYDGLGLWRDKENSIDVNAQGGIVKAAEGTLVRNLNGLKELAPALAQSAQVHACVSDEVYRFALGRNLTAADECNRSLLSKRFFASGGNFKDLMLAIVESKSFRSNLNPELLP
jgi:Protein of unknown function (DUF1592)/Protein of unknown function (DUF1588)/Protein of unknown function (DUF1587)/Protein of unknown function (DUF1595)/Protein of unknown function (DUF1585)